LGLDYEIIVVDNNSIDNSVEIINSMFNDVNVIALEKNFGFGVANNIGAKYSNAEYLFLLNSDTLLKNNAISILLDFMRNSNLLNIGACGGNLFKINDLPNFSYSTYFPSLTNIFFYRSGFKNLVKQDIFNTTNNIKEVSLIIGADLLIKRELFNNIGGFDERFFMYIEDGDLQYRLYKKGYKMYSIPNAEIYHLQGASSDTYFKLKMEVSGYLIYFKKHFNNFKVFLYKCIELFFSIVRIFFHTLTFNFRKVYMYFKLFIFVLKA
jgi:GT2 family glycosyltransferase